MSLMRLVPKVMLTKNLDVQDGLVNSAFGVVTGFHPQSLPDQDVQTFMPKYVFVKFLEERIGKRNRLQSKGILIDNLSTPIHQVETQVRFGKHAKVTAKRTQFPLCLAWSVTIHKEQGKTEEQLVVSCKGTFRAGQFYTAISRSKELSGLFILGDITTAKIKVNVKALEEIQSPRLAIQTTDISASPDSFLKIQCLNINSFLPHQVSFQKDFVLLPAQISCLSETWLKPSATIPDFQNYNNIRSDNINSQHRSGGLMTFIHHDLYLLKHYKVQNVQTEHMIMLMSPKRDMSIRICVTLVYHKTASTTLRFLKYLETIISKIPLRLPSFILGDFNVDMSLSTRSPKQLYSLLKYYGFHPSIHEPTHRQGGYLDNIFTNVQTTPRTDVIPKNYTDHFLISIAIPWIHLY